MIFGKSHTVPIIAYLADEKRVYFRSQIWYNSNCPRVAELVDALASGASLSN